MAHQTTRRRILASPDPVPSMDPTPKNHIHSKPIKNPDKLIPSKPFYLSNPLAKLNPVHKITTITHKPCANTRLQAKPMTVSADFDGSKISITKQQKRIESIPAKEKVKKLLSKGDVAVEKKKKVQVNDEKKKESKREAEMKKVQDLVVNDGKKKETKDLIEGLDIKRITVSLDGGGGCGRRRSLGGSQIELGDFLANNGAKIVSVDMPSFMQIHAVDCARKTHDSLEKFTSKTLALTLKKEFDAVYGPAWHCIVGTSFGSFVTHSVGGFLYFSMDQKLYVLLFKTTVQRAE